MAIEREIHTDPRRGFFLARMPVYDNGMIDAALRQRLSPYFHDTENPTLQGVLDYLCMVNSEIQEGEVWEPTDPRVIAIDAYINATVPPGMFIDQLEHDIHAVEALIEDSGDQPISRW